MGTERHFLAKLRCLDEVRRFFWSVNGYGVRIGWILCQSSSSMRGLGDIGIFR